MEIPKATENGRLEFQFRDLARKEDIKFKWN